MATRRKTPNSSKSMNKKRQILSDLSNFNLTPTSTLRKLVSSNLENVFPISVSKSDSNTPKPYNYSLNNNSTEVASETSVASSNFSSARNPNHVDVSSLRPAALLPTTSSLNPGWDDEIGVYNQRQTMKNSNPEATALPLASTLHEKKKVRTKEIADPFVTLPPRLTKDNRKTIVEPLPPRITKDKGKLIAEPLPPKLTKDKGKAIAEPFSSSSPVIKEDKGKGVLFLSSPVSGNKKEKGIHELLSPSPQTVKAKAKAISHEQAPSDDKTAEEKFGAISQSISYLKKTRGKQRADASVFSCPTLQKTSTNRKEFSGAGEIKPSGSCTDPNGKRKKVL